MKKFLSAIACAFAVAASAATTYTTGLQFSQKQFQPHAFKNDIANYVLTVPIIYKGTVTVQIEGLVKVEAIDKNSICVGKSKGTMPVYMTMCQPCLDCFPCRELTGLASDEPIALDKEGKDVTIDDEKITKWNMYYIYTFKESGVKCADIYKVSMIDAGYNFFTGSLKSNAVIYDLQDNANESSLWLAGKRSELTFKYYESTLTYDATEKEFTWKDAATKASTAYISSISSLSGVYDCLLQNDLFEGAATLNVKAGATFKLSRNSSLTKQAINDVFTATVSYTPSGNKHWQDCGEDVTEIDPASYCEAFFTNKADADEDGFDAYLVEKVYAKYDVDLKDAANLAAVLDDMFEGAY